MEAAVLDPVPGADSTPGVIRAFYTKSYKALDQFDQLWYDVLYEKRQNWQCNYLTHDKHESMRDFMRAFLTELRAYVKENY